MIVAVRQSTREIDCEKCVPAHILRVSAQNPGAILPPLTCRNPIPIYAGGKVLASNGPARDRTRAVAPACVLSFVVLSASMCSSTATFGAPTSTGLEAQHPRIIVAFPNEPQRSPGLAGTTGGHYKGSGYLIARSAHRAAQRLAAAYGLRMVASWPIKALAVHCVVYEIPDGRPVSELVAALTSDPSVAFAQPLQQFHTQARR